MRLVGLDLIIKEQDNISLCLLKITLHFYYKKKNKNAPVSHGSDTLHIHTAHGPADY